MKTSFTPPLMTSVQSGTFLMGDSKGSDDEKPPHEVSIRAFLIGTYPVTNREFQTFLNDSKYQFPIQKATRIQPECPITHVSWFDAIEYCRWLTDRLDLRYRLPTEAEWEYAARSGSAENTYPWGKTSLDLQGRFQSGPEPVGSFQPNTFGIHDMGLNVHEWCNDWYSADYYSSSPSSNPQGPSHGARKSSRGGSWRHQIKVTRCAARSSIPPEYRYADYGFRVAQDIL
jgi:sulfatase modifying factor 1